MTDKYRYVVDSSVWIEFERGKSTIREKLEPLLKKNRICMVDLIVAELLRGARSDKDYRGLALRLNSFEMLSTEWEVVAELGYRVAKGGFMPPLADLYIAQCVIDGHKTLVTQDKHFAQIAEVKHFSFVLW